MTDKYTVDDESILKAMKEQFIIYLHSSDSIPFDMQGKCKLYNHYTLDKLLKNYKKGFVYVVYKGRYVPVRPVEKVKLIVDIMQAVRTLLIEDGLMIREVAA